MNVIVGSLLFTVSVVLRAYTEYTWVSCLIFWLGMAVWTWPVLHRTLQGRVSMLGCMLNAIATLANGGSMPVAADHYMPQLHSNGLLYNSSWWHVMTEQTRVKFLCDVLWGFSLGDVCLYVSFFIMLFRIATNNRKAARAEEEVKA